MAKGRRFRAQTLEFYCVEWVSSFITSRALNKAWQTIKRVTIQLPPTRLKRRDCVSGFCVLAEVADFRVQKSRAAKMGDG